MLRAWTLGAATAATVIAVGLSAALLVAADGLPLVFTAAVVAALSIFALVRALWPLHRRPTDRQIARFLEEREPGSDDVVVTAVDYRARPDASPGMRQLLAADAARALAALDLDRIVPSDSIRQAALKAVAASAALGLTAALFAPSFSRADQRRGGLPLSRAHQRPGHAGLGQDSGGAAGDHHRARRTAWRRARADPHALG